AVGALSEPDHAHAAAAELARQAPRADLDFAVLGFDRARRLAGQWPPRRARLQAILEALRRVFRVEHRLDDALELGVLATKAVEQHVAVLRRRAEQALEDVASEVPARRIHGVTPCRVGQARAPALVTAVHQPLSS